MQPSKPAGRTRLLAALGALIVIGAALAVYYEGVSAPPSQGAQVSSLASVASSLSQLVSSQGSQIQSLQSEVSSSASAHTVTVTSTVSTVVESTTTFTTTETVSSVVTIQTTTTKTVTEVSTTVLPVGEPDAVTLSGTLSIPGGNGTGTLLIMVANTGNDPVIGISVAVPTGPDPTADLCTSTCTLTITYAGNPVTTSNPVPVQNNAMGSLTTNEGKAGEIYTIIVNVTYADGTTPPASTISLSPGT
jgi:hypothetical protein